MTFAWVNSVTPEELNSVTQLHQEALKESFLNNFGPKFLSILYQNLIQSSKNHTLLVKSDGKVQGFLLAVSDLKHQLPAILTLGLIMSLMHKPNLLFRILGYLLQSRPPSPAFELQFIAVDMKLRNKGIGTKMLKSLAKKLGHKSYFVGTKKNNQASNAFYKKNGFTFSDQRKIFGDIFNYYQSPA